MSRCGAGVRCFRRRAEVPTKVETSERAYPLAVFIYKRLNMRVHSRRSITTHASQITTQPNPLWPQSTIVPPFRATITTHAASTCCSPAAVPCKIHSTARRKIPNPHLPHARFGQLLCIGYLAFITLVLEITIVAT